MARGRQRIFRKIQRGGTARLRAHVSEEQLEVLISYMEQHLLFARGQIPLLGPQGHIKYQKMWQNLSNLLNKIGPRVKDVTGWQRFWTKIRLEAKLEKAKFMTALNRTGHNSINIELSDKNHRISSIYGKYGSGINLGKELGLNFVEPPEEEACCSWENELDQLLHGLQRLVHSYSIPNNKSSHSINNIPCDSNNQLGQLVRTKGARPIQVQFDKMFQVLKNNSEMRNPLATYAANKNDWDQLADELNAIAGGVSKEAKLWHKTWVDMVNNARLMHHKSLKGLVDKICVNHITAVDIVGLGFAPEDGDISLPNKRTHTESFPEDQHSNSASKKKKSLPSTAIASCSYNDYSMDAPSVLPNSTKHEATAGKKTNQLIEAVKEKGNEFIDSSLCRISKELQAQSQVTKSCLEEDRRLLKLELPGMVKTAIHDVLASNPYLPNSSTTQINNLTDKVEALSADNKKMMRQLEALIQMQALNQNAALPNLDDVVLNDLDDVVLNDNALIQIADPESIPTQSNEQAPNVQALIEPFEEAGSSGTAINTTNSKLSHSDSDDEVEDDEVEDDEVEDDEVGDYDEQYFLQALYDDESEEI